MSTALPSRPIDATLTVTKAARLLGVHPNTVRAWSDAGRLRYYRINPRGDRRYRLGDLQRFMAAAEKGLADPGMLPAGLGPVGRRSGLAATIAAGGSRRPNERPSRPAADPLDAERDTLDLTLIESITRSGRSVEDFDDRLERAAILTRTAGDHYLAAVWELRDDRLVARAVDRSTDAAKERLIDRPRAYGVLGAALAEDVVGGGRGTAITRDRSAGPIAILTGDRAELAVVIPGHDGPWGVLHIVAERSVDISARDARVTEVVADQIAEWVAGARREASMVHQLHRAEALNRVAGDIGSRLDLDRVLAGLVDHAMVLFEADRGAVFLVHSDGTTTAEVSRGLSATYLAAVRDPKPDSLPGRAATARRPLFAIDYRNDPGAAEDRAAVVQEGFDTISCAPLFDGDQLLGLLTVYHDQPHAWFSDDLDTLDALAGQASAAIRAAQDYARMATWAAQLQSIQQLGTRLNRLSVVREIGQAIATELRQLIDSHSVRVYRQIGDELVPVAMQGQLGEYVDETPDQLRVAVGEGITGWVAEHGVPQRLADAASDPRGSAIPGTEPDLPESMLLAPMSFDDRVLGVLVLSKLGLDQFTDDDLRLLVIYASFAAQAMANADTTERLREQSAALERQVREPARAPRRSPSRSSSTLDGRNILESITERLGDLVACDNIAIEVVDPATGPADAADRTRRPRRRVHASRGNRARRASPRGWSSTTSRPISKMSGQTRGSTTSGDAADQDGSLIVVPLRGRDGAVGVLTMERIGLGITFAPDEFELVQLFAAQVSIAMQNAEVFRAVEIRAQTDDLTGLLNHGTFQDRLERAVHGGSPFSLIMLDLDDFREVNNSLGHQAGDALLREIAKALIACRPRDRPDLPLRRRRVLDPPSRHRRRRRPPRGRAGRGSGPRCRRRRQRVDRVATYPDRRRRRRRHPAGGRPGLLRRQARWARPDRDRGRRPRPGRRVLAEGADAGRLRAVRRLTGPGDGLAVTHVAADASISADTMRDPRGSWSLPGRGRRHRVCADASQPADPGARIRRAERRHRHAHARTDAVGPHAVALVRASDPDAATGLRRLHGQAGRHARDDRQALQHDPAEHRLLEPGHLSVARPGIIEVPARPDRAGLGAARCSRITRSIPEDLPTLSPEADAEADALPPSRPSASPP